MPPKAAIAVPPPLPSPSPPPSAGINDAQDLLIVQDFMDTLDQIPPELTRVNSDLNELGAVLYATLCTLEEKLHTLTSWIQDPRVGPEKRFQLLQEIAEEAARYKLGGDDKIRVAGGACDGIMAHQKHISNLLAASTLLQSGPPSPYTQALTLAQPLPPPNTRRGGLARAANSPFGGRGYASGSGTGEAGREKDTPSKKKKSRVQQLGMREDDETSSVGGGKKGVIKKRKHNRAASPADSLGSTSAFTGKPIEPRTARQLAAAANKARKVEADDGSDDEDEPLARKGVAMQITPSSDSVFDRGGLGLDIGAHSREGSNQGEKARNRARGTKRARGDEEDDDDSELDGEAELNKPVPKRTGSNKRTNPPPLHHSEGSDHVVTPGVEMDVGAEGDADSTLYCTCRQVSYGEMIGCDDDECEIEWYHVACLGLDRAPGGDWICPQCAERRKRQPNKKKTSKSKGRGK